MKKILGLLLGVLCVATIGACNTGDGQSVDSTESVQSSQTDGHVHTLKRVSERTATCIREGNITYWTCEECDTYFADENGATEITKESTVLAKSAHTLTKAEGLEPTCTSKGKKESWTCSKCTKIFGDEACTVELSKIQLALDKAPHALTHHEVVLANGKENGVKEHWSCETCAGNFMDENGTEKVSDATDLILYSLWNIPDFVVEVPADRDPVVLQLSDTQIIDAAQARDGRTGVDYAFWATDQVEERCYNYVKETIEATNPDFIIITGDVVYGEFDDSGTALTGFIDFMESFQIPWSPVFGNHDNESKKGVDWQCDQFEAATYCYFKQNTVKGNGNYSVGIMQGGELQRVFYMLDSNGCGNASQESKDNGQTMPSLTGFDKSQINWYTNHIAFLKEYAPNVKLSFAYHIQQAVFGEAYAKYGFDQNDKLQGEDEKGINLDTMEGVAEGDFGFIGRQMKGAWDANKTVYNGMKEMGVDSIFVGHEHCNSVSVVYEGIRFQYGQKSSEYDRFNCIDENGVITGGYSKTGTSLIGGSVIVLSKEDGTIKDAYNYYCDDAGDIVTNGKINWDYFGTNSVTVKSRALLCPMDDKRVRYC